MHITLSIIYLDRTPKADWPLENLQRELEGVTCTMKHIQGREMRAAGIKINSDGRLRRKNNL